MNKTSIPWTQYSWNPVHGCTPAGPECDRCYARAMARRLKGSGARGYENGFAVTMRPDRLGDPAKLRKPQMVFLCSMGDLFHERVSYTHQSLVFDTMMEVDRHVYQVLTKRPGRMKEFVREWTAERFSDPDDWYKVRHIWLGTSLGTQRNAIRALELVEVPGRNRFLSLEPLLEDVDISPILHASTPRTNALWRGHTSKTWPGANLIEWVLVGGETGSGARPIRRGWADKVWGVCRRVQVPFFFKSWGATKVQRPECESWNVEEIKEFPVDIEEHLGLRGLRAS